jgi:hypothetical protein
MAKGDFIVCVPRAENRLAGGYKIAESPPLRNGKLLLDLADNHSRPSQTKWQTALTDAGRMVYPMAHSGCVNQ